MFEKYLKIKNVLLPNKKLNYFVFSIICIGFITGCIFFMLIGNNDKKIVIESVMYFINNVNNNGLELFKNISIINFIYLFLLILFSLSVVGSFLNVIVIYFKSFILGFTISSLFLTYNIKGVLISFCYLIPAQLINLFIIYVLGIYSLLFSCKLLGQVFNIKDKYIRIFLKKYIFIILICLILTIMSTIFEAFVFPFLLKFIKVIL